MKNAWIDEINVRKIITDINKNLTSEFAGKISDIKSISDFLMKIIHHTGLAVRIKDVIMWQYNLEFVEKNGKIETLELVKHPWYV